MWVSAAAEMDKPGRHAFAIAPAAVRVLHPVRYAICCQRRAFEILSAAPRRFRTPWRVQDSCPDYMLKAEECLRLEEERVDNYLHATTRNKLLKEVRGRLGGCEGWGNCRYYFEPNAKERGGKRGGGLTEASRLGGAVGGFGCSTLGGAEPHAASLMHITESLVLTNVGALGALRLPCTHTPACTLLRTHAHTCLMRLQVETELLSNYETRLLTKEHSGCAALLRDDKVGRGGSCVIGAQ